jgi:hypothetical protein
MVLYADQLKLELPLQVFNQNQKNYWIFLDNVVCSGTKPFNATVQFNSCTFANYSTFHNVYTVKGLFRASFLLTIYPLSYNQFQLKFPKIIRMISTSNSIPAFFLASISLKICSASTGTIPMEKANM